MHTFIGKIIILFEMEVTGDGTALCVGVTVQSLYSSPAKPYTKLDFLIDDKTTVYYYEQQ